MGSFQQIFLGAFCVGGAFLMGHYLHHQTPPNSPFEDKTATPEFDKRVEDLKQRRERIAMLPNFRTQARLAPLFQKEQDLPPPSQLDGTPSNPSPSNPSLSNPSPSNPSPSNPSPSIPSLSKESTRQLDLGDQALDIEVPDFSELAAQFEGMALKLPDLNAAPVNAADAGSVTQLPQTASTPEVVNPAPSNTERSGSALNGLPPRRVPEMDQPANPHLPANEAAIVPNFHTPINPVADLIQAERDAAPRINPVAESTETSFRPEDFAPRLRTDISGSEIQPGNSNPESVTAFPVTNLSEVSSIPVSKSILETSPGNVIQPPHPKAVISYNDPFQDSMAVRSEADRPSSSINPPTVIGSGLEPKQSPAGNSGLTSSGSTLGWDKQNPTPVDQEAKSVLGQPANSTAVTETKVRAGSQIPFGLNELERSRLSRLNLDSPQSNTVPATRFKEYRTEMGDTLQSIASKFYGKPEYFLDIYLANRDQLRTPAQVPAGIILKLPVYE